MKLAIGCVSVCSVCAESMDGVRVEVNGHMRVRVEVNGHMPKGTLSEAVC